MLVMKGGSTAYQTVERGSLAVPFDQTPAGRLPWTARGSVNVEVLVTWALRDQRAGQSPTRGLFQAEAEASGLTWYSASSDGCAAIDRIGSVGCRIDVSGPGRDALHPAAEAVADAIELADERDLLRLLGRVGERPDWRGPPRWIVPESWVVEGVEAMWCYAERRTGKHCPLIIVCDAATIAAKRAVYVRWWDALEGLAWTLSCRALGFAVTGPAAAREPWETAA